MSTSNRKTPYHHGDLRASLIDAGLAILEEGADPAALSLREAARRVGVSAMAPYRHFADKEALLAAIATVGFERLAAAQREADKAAAPVAALTAQGVAYVAFAEASPALFRLMFGRGGPARTASLDAASDASFALLAERVGSLVPAAQAKDQVLACWSLVHGLAMLAVDGKLAPFGEPPLTLAARIAALPLGFITHRPLAGATDENVAKAQVAEA